MDKVCELGLLNYKVKHVFHPSEKRKFRCRYDYYWASVFEVEYTDHSGRPHTAFAEALNEALPHDCRPIFYAALWAKDSFKNSRHMVNETYDCWYILGTSKLNLYYDEYFKCQADQLLMTEMLNRYLILSTEILMSTFSHTGQWRYMYLSLEVIAGTVMRFLASLVSIALVRRILYLLKSRKSRFDSTGQVTDVYLIRLKQVCVLVAYFSVVSWLAVIARFVGHLWCSYIEEIYIHDICSTRFVVEVLVFNKSVM
ncbi:uncharacterized protein LOC143604278 [Bidens hawaiensis]|uniref:uncharacterized protein LOC143604278 n=1 Tax=Bidens hawaiensis TaxID=980011 RepID=UPI0040490C7F